ncbi:hypothetical protein [Acinetobacter indicus]|uniref:hypothetical protein n=1 Tax=Acinetobacter indicus TaxID=756892 RepID=UPI00398A0F2E
MKSLLKKLKTVFLSLIKGTIFVLINIISFLFSRKIDETVFGEYVVRGCKRSELYLVANFLIEMRSNAISSPYRKIIYLLFSEKTIFIAIKNSGNKEIEILGVNLYYVNLQDFKNSTVHGGYIGVSQKKQGLGIATNLRCSAKKHFYNSGFVGISSRISVSNIASLRTAQKMGYIVESKYYDYSTNEERYYMICKLGSTNDVK